MRWSEIVRMCEHEDAIEQERRVVSADALMQSGEAESDVSLA